jgi:hypothetical protein
MLSRHTKLRPEDVTQNLHKSASLRLSHALWHRSTDVSILGTKSTLPFSGATTDHRPTDIQLVPEHGEHTVAG